MQFLLFLVIVAAMIGAVASGVVYVTQEPERSSIHLDKVRLEEVTNETTSTVKKAVETVQQEATEIGEKISGEREKTPEEKKLDELKSAEKKAAEEARKRY
jgi:uncharacterized membrane protein